MELAQEERAERLQWAVLNCPVDELVNIYEELGGVEMSAPALGLACRFRGVDVVRALVEKGATFDFPSTGKPRKNTAVISARNTQITALIIRCICSNYSAED